MTQPSNPYTPPVAHVDDERVSVGKERFNPQGRRRPLHHGWTWIADSWRIFASQPGTWVLAILVFAAVFILYQVAVAMLMAASPTAGFVITQAFGLVMMIAGPLFTIGFIVMANAVRRGERAELGMLLAGFRRRTGALLLLGLLYLVGLIVVLAVIGAVLYATGVFEGRSSMTTPEALPVMVLGFFLLWMGLICATVFSPISVYFDDRSPLEAIQSSFVGSIKNILPGIVCSILFGLIMVLSILPLLLGLLVTLPMAFILTYAAYRDIYLEPV
jgi:uncharacterized membrane protein